MPLNLCDSCFRSINYTIDNPFVQYRTRRPSDPAEMTCTLAGHAGCFGVEKVPRISGGTGWATPEQWEAWLKSADAKAIGIYKLG